jgi:nucleoside-diphosphate-sugar epimerase
MTNPPRFEGRKAAVTGAGGFIGNATCRELVGRGAEVVGLELLPDSAPRVMETGAAFQVCDVTDPEALDRGLDGVELVVHTAAHVREWGEMDDFIRVNVGGTREVLDAAERAGVERVLHVSAGVVYGYDAPGELDEEADHRPSGIPKNDTKSASDALALRRGAVVVRPGDVYGPRSVPWAVRPIELAKTGELLVPGSGAGLMLPTYIDDLVDAILLGLSAGEPGRAYTAWDGQPVTFEDYFGRIAAIVGGRPPRRVPRAAAIGLAAAFELVAKVRGQPPRFSRNAITLIDRRGTASNARLREELEWEPRVQLDEGMRRVEEWAREEELI